MVEKVVILEDLHGETLEIGAEISEIGADPPEVATGLNFDPDRRTLGTTNTNTPPPLNSMQVVMILYERGELVEVYKIQNL